METLRDWARTLKREIMTLWFALRHPDTPWHARALAAVIVAYALSPIDLIPDFIPVLGYLDELILLPGLIWILLKLLPGTVLRESRAEAERWFAEGRDQPPSRAGLVIVVSLWALSAGGLWALFAG